MPSPAEQHDRPEQTGTFFDDDTGEVMATMKRALTVEEVAARLHRKKRSTLQFLKQRHIPSWREGRHRLVLESDLNEYLDKKARERAHAQDEAEAPETDGEA